MTTKGTAIVLMYSVTQKAFDRRTIQEVIFHNLKMIANGKSIDFLPIGVFSSYEKCQEFYEKVRPLIEEIENMPAPLSDVNLRLFVTKYGLIAN